MSKIASNIFLQSALAEVPRLLGLLNRNPASHSYGSFDRAFWHYRTADISCARYQEAVLTLALLYANDFEENIYYQDSRVLEWINAAIGFSLSLQDRDGSFSEWYLHESSFVATAFVTAALSETLLVLGEQKIRGYKKAVDVLCRAADWLTSLDEELVRNQESGSMLALVNVWLLTRDERYRMSAFEKAKRFTDAQVSEGWWSEYGGPDIGYLSLTIDYLAKYSQKYDDQRVVEAIRKSSAFLTNFLHPNYTVGGEYGSRNTEYLIPSGFVLLSDKDQNMRLIAEFCAHSLALQSGIGPSNLDDRYLAYILYNWLQAGLIYVPSDGGRIRRFLAERRVDTFFPMSGIRVVDRGIYYFVANLYKGGAFRVYAPGKTYLDSGADIISRGHAYTSNVLDKNNGIHCVSAVAKEFSTSGFLKFVSEPLMKTPIMLLFKMFQLTIGQSGILRKFLKKVLRKGMITDARRSSISFKRSFVLTDNGVRIVDVVGAALHKEDIYYGRKSSYNFIPSSKYFLNQEVGGERSNFREPVFSVTGDTTTTVQELYW
ncbi:MAG: hypothetical protein A3A28_04960 [Candidatus Sungbacteria bacterium RIFCSPLOWO2_01_FULL_47_32]|nr:MAG: hypothetical protein A3A28_04960 [Candidatus Sungbacteria bacterium RIFCSPLOWO2_01_FULL_47_32]